MGNADDDPVRAGLVASYAHPGGNVTGYTNSGSDLAGKRLGLLRDLIPGLSRVAILWQPDIDTSTAYVEETEAAAATIGVKIKRLPVRAASELAGAFREAVESGAKAVIVPGVALMNSHQRTIVDLAIAGDLPLMANHTPFADAGALISYDADRRERFQQVAGYVPHPERRRPGRSASVAPDQVRTGDQPQDRQGSNRLLKKSLPILPVVIPWCEDRGWRCAAMTGFVATFSAI
jgi:ABC-type uncharacterized transport system substrate-binding protein